MPGHEVVSNIMAFIGDFGEEVTFWAKFHDNKGAIRTVHDLGQGDNVWAVSGLVVQSDFTLLEFTLSRIETGFVERLDGIQDIGSNVTGLVDGSVCSHAEDGGQLDTVGKNKTQTILGVACLNRPWRCWRGWVCLHGRVWSSPSSMVVPPGSGPLELYYALRSLIDQVASVDGERKGR